MADQSSSNKTELYIASVAVIIINYQTASLTVKAVESVLAHTHGGRDIHIHIVDNASPDDSMKILKNAYKEKKWEGQVTLHLAQENRGFGCGNNIILKQLADSTNPPDAVFFLNPDAELKNEAIDILATNLEQTQSTGFAGAQLSTPDGSYLASAFRFPSVISEFSGALNFGPIDRFLKSWRVPLSEDQQAGLVDWVTGAAFLARFSMIKKIGFFDSAFFLYYEEVDLMHNAARQGIKTIYEPNAQVVHIAGASTGISNQRSSSMRMPEYHYFSWQYYFQKNYSRSVAVLTVIARLVGASGNVIISFLRGRDPALPYRFFSDFWRYCARPILGMSPRR